MMYNIQIYYIIYNIQISIYRYINKTYLRCQIKARGTMKFCKKSKIP